MALFKKIFSFFSLWVEIFDPGNLNDSFQGDYASKYDESFGQFTKQVKSSHESLRNVESFLDTIVTVMENQ